MEAMPLFERSTRSDDPMEDKIIPFSLTTEGDSLLELHVDTLKARLEEIFREELAQTGLIEKLPLVKWNECTKVPGAFQIYLLSSAHRKQEIHLFFHEMVSGWLVNGDPLHILSSRNLTFQLKEQSRSYYFIELLVLVEKEKHLSLVHRNLPALAKEIKLGALSKGYARHIIDTKRLNVGGSSTSYLYEMIIWAMRRHPNSFEQDIFREIQRFLIHCKEEFRQIRENRHLARLILSHYLFNREIQKELKSASEKRHLHIKLFNTHLQYPFAKKKVLGLAITLNSLRDYECFEQRHILKAVQRLLPDAIYVQDSFYSHRHDENKILSLYLEFEKAHDGEFSLTDLLLLRKKLVPELKNSIEYLAPSLFIPRNEEELYRNIIALSQELKYVHDLPQAIISFQEQSADVLRFNVILLRLLQHNSPSLQELSRLLPPQDRFIPERVANVGTLRKKYHKEANIFVLEVESRLFLRNNHSVDLVKARQYVVHSLTRMVGQFRDYNGGFLLKQNEQLESIKKEWGEESKQNEFLIENLFYSLTPSIMQTLISPVAGKALCDLFLKTLDLSLPKHLATLIEKKEVDHSLSVVIKARQGDLKEKLTVELQKLDIDPLKLASSLVEHEGYYYLCYLYLDASPMEVSAFSELIENTLHHLAKKQLTLQAIRLFLPHATQSLDPRIGADRTSGIVIKMLYEGLMRPAKNGGVECAIAKSVEISKDRKRYCFKLRESKWSNGSPLTAYDFEYAWKKILDPAFRFPYSFLLFMIKNAELAKKGEVPLSEVGITVIDELTLVVDLEYPAPYFLGLTAHWTYSPLCCEIDQRHPGWAYQSAESHVSNGPFKLAIWKLNDDLAVVKNPYYWDVESVQLGKIEISIVEDEDVAFQMFKKEEVDWYGDPVRKIPYKETPILEKTMKVEQAGHSGFFWLQLNIEQPIFSNANLRKAFSYAINRKKMIDKVLKRDDCPALRFKVDTVENTPYTIKDGDAQLAKHYFEKGLKEAGLKHDDLMPIMFSHSEIPEHEALSKEIGKQWEQVLGVEVQYERLLWNNYFDNLNRRYDFMVGGLSWYARYDDPLYYLELLTTREGAPYVTKWKNATYSKLVEQAKHALGAKREKVIIEAEKVLLDAMPLIPILFDKLRYVKNPRLKDVILSTIGQIDFRCAYLEKQ